ncbi:hypothetical protein TNCV_4906791 [Trichonephila clavipes]|uniref:Uncharacterized protein n=1 Tax=Trichonephila clavipes TaxID=2585209 RepID=A0A8X6RSK2_TRICX|nr:hypothetical protein TNCV_4906791 [Trichonephila clavipes]
MTSDEVTEDQFSGGIFTNSRPLHGPTARTYVKRIPCPLISESLSAFIPDTFISLQYIDENLPGSVNSFPRINRIISDGVEVRKRPSPPFTEDG